MADRKVAIVGAGPVGTLAGLYFANAGWEVEIYELRGDLRLPENRAAGSGKSINLALSERGISGLGNNGDGGKLLEGVLKETIPMHGRMIHSGRVVEDGKGGVKGEEGEAQNYDVHGRFIRSADRARLNEILLDELEKRDNAKIFFEHKLRRLRLDENVLVFEKRKTGETVTVKADLVVGADGAHSAVRDNMMRYVRMDYQQTYINTLWCEFEMPPSPTTGDFAISPNHLHIWPKHTHMFIAIPSPDKSFTCTLFAPPDTFESIGNDTYKLLEFFKEHYTDVIDLLGGPAELTRQFLHNEHLPLISIKCSPFHYKDKAVIVGDAAHAMVPFYGQGMNAGFESVEHLCKHIFSTPDLEAALESYSKERVPDAHAICDLAMENYEEMRSKVTSRVYLARKGFEESMYKWFPGLGVKTMYSSVSFGNERYSEVLVKAERLRAWEDRVVFGMGTVGVMVAGLWLLRGDVRRVVKAVRVGFEAGAKVLRG